MKENGKIISINKDICTIEIDANSGCHTCTLKSKCHASSRGKRRIDLKINTSKFNVGDKVELETKPKSVIAASFLVFILPLIISIAAYFIATNLFSIKEYGPLVFFVFFILAELLIFVIDKMIGGHSFFGPEVVRRIES